MSIRLQDDPVASPAAMSLQRPPRPPSSSTPEAASAVQAALDAIPELTGNVAVTGSTGGPYTIMFSNGLTGVNVSQFTADGTGRVRLPAPATTATVREPNITTMPSEPERDSRH